MSEEKTSPQATARKSLRSPLLVLKAKVDDGARCFFGYAKNISRGGLFIATVSPREPGSTFQVEIPLPPPLKRKIRCNCEVVWKREFSRKSPFEPGMGLKFIDLPEDQATLIDDWVRSASL